MLWLHEHGPEASEGIAVALHFAQVFFPKMKRQFRHGKMQVSPGGSVENFAAQSRGFAYAVSAGHKNENIQLRCKRCYKPRIRLQPIE